MATNVRASLDRLVSWVGLALVGVLLAAAGGLWYASHFINDQVHDQLVMQDITMPTKEAFAELDTKDQDALEPYAGSKLDTGDEAKAFADHYILAHMNAASGGRTYEEVSGEFIGLSDEEKASEEGQQLGQLRQTLFMGNTLRGLLLYGYAFATMGKIAGIAAVASAIGALLFLVLSVMGFRHAGRPVRRV